MIQKRTPEEIRRLLDALIAEHPDAICELDYGTPFQLLVAVILSAQCTDKRVNQVTKRLFEHYRTPEEFARMPQEELEKRIYSCGFYKNKAKNIISAARDIVEKFHGQVPDNIAELMTLAGVGRKTANVVFSEAFGGDAIAVDTHVLRLANRLGFAQTDQPMIAEKALMEALPQERWSQAHHLLIHHGRYTCHSRNPECEKCTISEFCVYRKPMPQDNVTRPDAANKEEKKGL